jgi:hypothetical protein
LFSKDPAFTPEQLTGGSNRTVFGNNNESHYGIKVSTGSVLIGKTISQVSFRLKQNQSPSSSNLVYVRVWRSGSFSHTFGTTAPSNIAVGTYAFYSFGTGGDFVTSSDGSITIQDGDRIVLSWDRGSGGNSEYIHMEYSSSDVYDGVKTGVALSTVASPTQESDWAYDNTGRDIVFKLVGTEPSTWTREGYGTLQAYAESDTAATGYDQTNTLTTAIDISSLTAGAEIVSLGINAGTAAGNVLLGLYQGVNPLPTGAAKLAETASTTMVVGIQYIDLTTPYVLTATDISNGVITVAIAHDSGSARLYTNSTSTARSIKTSNTVSNGMPSTWTRDVSSNGGHFNVYLGYYN